MKEHNVSEFSAKTAYRGKSRSRVKGQIRAQFGPKSTFLIFIWKPFNIFFWFICLLKHNKHFKMSVEWNFLLGPNLPKSGPNRPRHAAKWTLFKTRSIFGPPRSGFGTYKFTCVSVCVSVCLCVCLSHLYLQNGSKDFFETLHDD